MLKKRIYVNEKLELDIPKYFDFNQLVVNSDMYIES